MDFAFTEEQEELRESARGFLEEFSGSEQVRRAAESELGYDPELWKQLGSELGWTSVVIPEEYGGLGLSYVELVALLEMMGGALLCAPFFSSICLGGNALLIGGTEEQKQQHLPGIAEGQTRATLAATEANGRWDAMGIEALARADGGDFVLNGTKTFVIDGHCADLLIVAARREGSSGEEGISLFVVPGDAPGIERRSLPTMDQTRRQAEVALRDVRLPAGALMGEVGAGWAALKETLERAAVALSAEQVGGAQRCLDM
ncbi:MAG: acyl-CoA/acyl-ACP dehydrogenase, partial [Deltaproteobacteria bacterium]|nr:acyl-CoA/acyl-ACP dehydrogenase [Deltaproteobacteria bacterium]